MYRLQVIDKRSMAECKNCEIGELITDNYKKKKSVDKQNLIDKE
jgi:hypothetical protein